MAHITGRGSQSLPPNRFEKIHAEDDFEHLTADDEYLQHRLKPKTEYFADTSRTIISENEHYDVCTRHRSQSHLKLETRSR